MPLTNSSQTMGSDSFADPPSSDNDPYETSTNSNRTSVPYNIDVTGFPRPMPIFGSMLGWTDDYRNKVILKSIQEVSKALGRPPSQEEATALTYWISKQISYTSYGGPLGIAGGIYRAISTRSTFRFPFYRPDLETFDRTVFPARSLPLLKGELATIAWQSARGFVYATVGRGFGVVFMATYAASVCTVGRQSDPRLKEYVEAVTKRVQERVRTKPGNGNIEAQRRPGVVQAEGSQMDDASPTGGMYGQDTGMDTASTSPYNSPTTNYETSTPSRPQNTQTRPNATYPQSRTQSIPTPAYGQSQSQSPQDSSFDMFDDASPTASPQSQSQSQPQGSAWDRLRRGEKPSPIQTPSRTPQPRYPQERTTDGSPRADRSYSISQSEEEKSYAKDEAQKEFDARVERERSGNDGWAGREKKW